MTKQSTFFTTPKRNFVFVWKKKKKSAWSFQAIATLFFEKAMWGRSQKKEESGNRDITKSICYLAEDFVRRSVNKLAITTKTECYQYYMNANLVLVLPMTSLVTVWFMTLNILILFLEVLSRFDKNKKEQVSHFVIPSGSEGQEDDRPEFIKQLSLDGNK